MNGIGSRDVSDGSGGGCYGMGAKDNTGNFKSAKKIRNAVYEARNDIIQSTKLDIQSV